MTELDDIFPNVANSVVSDIFCSPRFAQASGMPVLLAYTMTTTLRAGEFTLFFFLVLKYSVKNRLVAFVSIVFGRSKERLW